MGSGVMGYGHIIMALVWLFIIGLGILLLATLFPKSTGKPDDPPQDRSIVPDGSAEQILKRRYARGEISKAQYERMRHELRLSNTYEKGTNNE